MILKTIQDYYDIISQEYPDIPLSDIKRILQYGYKSLYLHNSYGGDVLLNLRGFWFYSGYLTNNSLKHYSYYCRKLKVKLRVLYKRKQIPWDGYYYFALTENLYKLYLKDKNKRGRPRKNFIFSKIILYKLYDECNIMEHNRVAIFRIPMISELGFTFYKEELKTNSAEFLLYRKPLKFEDILVTTNNYTILNNKQNG